MHLQIAYLLFLATLHILIPFSTWQIKEKIVAWKCSHVRQGNNGLKTSRKRNKFVPIPTSVIRFPLLTYYSTLKNEVLRFSDIRGTISRVYGNVSMNTAFVNIQMLVKNVVIHQYQKPSVFSSAVEKRKD
jgi:hypothetical protein